MIARPRLFTGLHGVWNGTGGLVYNASQLPAAAAAANLSHAIAQVCGRGR
jgi:hypothetical protein